MMMGVGWVAKSIGYCSRAGQRQDNFSFPVASRERERVSSLFFYSLSALLSR